jgi:hypothetical protein
MKNVMVIRLQTGEDIIAEVSEENGDVIMLKNAFVIIPMQSKPGQPVQLMMTPYMPYSADDVISIAIDKIVTQVKPKKDILNSYQLNTSSIITADKGLITETKLP